MNIPLVDLKAQYQTLKPEIDAAIATVVSETAFIGNLSNKHVLKFEAEFSAYTGASHTIACANGTDSLEILLKAAGIGPGDEVLVPAISWIATSEAVSNNGATPVFVDIEPDCYCMDIAAAAKKITPRTKAIIPVHLYGQPADMDAVTALAKKHGLFVLEDCAQAHGAAVNDKMVGRIGNAGSFSFFPGKNLGAYGDAGGMITDDEKIAENARMIAQHGQSKAKHDHKIEGRNSRLDGIQAAILSVKLPHLEAWTENRRKNAALYRKLLQGTGLQLQAERPNSRHVYHLFVIQVDDREVIAKKLSEAGIATTLQYPRALPLLTAYQRFGHKPEEFPNAVKLAARCLSLPMYPELNDEMIIYITDQLKSILAGQAK
jgi:dTDP-4-amino-4,6-dideoxygalactose transaminase